MAENAARGLIAAPDRTTRAGWLRRECGSNRFTVRLNLSFGQMAPSTHGRPGGVAHSEWAEPALVRPGRRPASPRLRIGRFWRKLPTRHLTLVTPKPPFEATVGGWRGVAQSLYNHRAPHDHHGVHGINQTVQDASAPAFSLSLSAMPCAVPCGVPRGVRRGVQAPLHGRGCVPGSAGIGRAGRRASDCTSCSSLRGKAALPTWQGRTRSAPPAPCGGCVVVRCAPAGTAPGTLKKRTPPAAPRLPAGARHASAPRANRILRGGESY